MIVSRTSTYVGVAPAFKRRCCCSGPDVSFIRTAILIWSGSVVLLSLSYLERSNSQLENDSSKLLLSNVGLSSFVRYPMLLVPNGMANLLLSCL